MKPENTFYVTGEIVSKVRHDFKNKTASFTILNYNEYWNDVKQTHILGKQKFHIDVFGVVANGLVKHNVKKGDEVYVFGEVLSRNHVMARIISTEDEESQYDGETESD